MLRYVIQIPRSGAFEAGPEAPPNADDRWDLSLDDRRARVWTRDALSGADFARLADGLLLGRTSRTATTAAEVARDWGAYVCLSVSPRGEVSVWRDPSGKVPAWRARSAAFDLICSHIEDLAEFGCLDMEIDWPYLTFLLANEAVPARRTGIVGISELLPGEAVRSSPAAPASTHLMWDPSAFYGEPILTSAEAQTAFRRAAEGAVNFWVRRHNALTLDLSGGLDSSIILGLLASSPLGPSVTAVNCYVGRGEIDERAFARDAAALHGTRLVEVDLQDQVADYRTPTGWSLQARPTSRLLRLGFGGGSLDVARDVGASAYATGRGGDHIFFHSASIATARDCLQLTHNLGAWLRAAFAASRRTGTPVRTVLADVFSRDSAAERLDRAMCRDNEFLAPDAKASIRALDFVHPWILTAADKAPPAKFIQVTNLVELQRHYDRVERAEVLEEVQPFISQPCIEFGLRTATHVLADAERRQLQRDTFRDLLPPSVYRRRTKGATTNRTLRTLIANLPYLREQLLEGELRRQGVLDLEALDRRLTSTSLQGKGSHVDLKHCVFVEMWLASATGFVERARAGRDAPRSASVRLLPALDAR